MKKYMRIALGVMGWVAVLTASAQGQLQFTEIMANSVDSEPKWEWVEVYNAGATDVDLNGYVFSRTSGANPLTAENISSANGGNTVIPARTAAVVYNAGATALDFDESRFRTAWTLPATVPLIGVTPAPSYQNSNGFDTVGRSIGLWPSLADYNMDFGQAGADTVLGNLDDYVNAVAAIEYTQFDDPAAPAAGLGFPSTGTGGVSLAWNGTGSYTDGTQWALSDPANVGTNGILTSVQVTLPPSTENVNSIADVGNPGTGSAAAIALPGLSITEVMYNPRSPDADWEFVEVRNNTGAAIDFSATPHILHDGDGTALSATNINAGSIPDQSFAVFYDSALSAADLTAAWDAGATGINFIPVDNWPAVGNGGDDLGVWSTQAAYDADIATGAGDSTAWMGALTSFAYDDDGLVFPQDDGNGSIHFTGDTNAFSSGWDLSFPGDGISVNPAQVTIVTSLEDHTGGDTGSPGTFLASTGLACDLDSNGQCDLDDMEMLIDNVVAGTAVADDIVTWLAEASDTNNPFRGGESTFVLGDANLDGRVDSDDLGLLLNNFNSTTNLDWMDGNMNGDSIIDSEDLGQLLNNFNFTSASAAAVPEPNSLSLLALAMAGLVGIARRK